MKTLIHHPGALGDVLLSLPCFRIIREDASHLHFIGRSDVAEFLRDAGVVDEASSADSARFTSFYARVDECARTFLEGFDRAFVFTSGAELDIASVIPRTHRIRTTPPSGAGIPVARYRLTQFNADLPGETAFSSLQLSRERLDAAAALLRHHGWTTGRGLLAIHPGSGGRSKCWLLDRYLELAHKIHRDGKNFIILFSGPAESPDTTQELDLFAQDHALALHAASMKLIDAAALLSLCTLYVGNDSGMTHLAAALGRPVIALFGPSDPQLWKPAGNRVTVVSAGASGSMEDISQDTVYTEAISALSAFLKI